MAACSERGEGTRTRKGLRQDQTRERHVWQTLVVRHQDRKGTSKERSDKEQYRGHALPPSLAPSSARSFGSPLLLPGPSPRCGGKEGEGGAL